METTEIIGLVLEILAFVGGSSVIAALVPARFLKLIPGLQSLINILAANFLNAKNDPETENQ